MRICNYLCGVLLLIFSVNVSAQDCKQHEWVREDGRSQAGGWVWFPGKGSHASLSIATLRAEGSALEYLKGECQRIPKDTKFNEKCVERVGGNFVVHIRAAIRDRKCSSGDDVNRELTQRHLSYKASQIQQNLNQSICNRTNPIGCYQLADKSWRSKNMELAMAYSEAACTYGDQFSCGFLGFLHYKLSNVAEAKTYLEMGCYRDGTKVWCDLLNDLETQLKNS